MFTTKVATKSWTQNLRCNSGTKQLICFTSPYIQVDIARLQECVATPYDDPNWENVCILPPEDRSTIEKEGVSRAKDRSTMATTLDVIFVASMYLNTGDRCGVTVKVEAFRF